MNGFEQDGRYSLGRSTPQDNSLVIDNVTLQNGGLYSCKTTEQSILRTLSLNVSGKAAVALVVVVVVVQGGS